MSFVRVAGETPFILLYFLFSRESGFHWCRENCTTLYVGFRCCEEENCKQKGGHGQNGNVSIESFIFGEVILWRAWGAMRAAKLKRL